MIENLFNFIAGQEWIFVIIIAAVFIFGAKKIPELARWLGLGLKEFKKAKQEIKDEVKNVTDEVRDIEGEGEK